MMIAFIDSMDVVHKLVSVGQAVNFASVLKCLRVAIQYKKLYKWRNLWPLYYDSVPCDTGLTVQHFLVKTIPHPLLISCHVISEMTQVWAQRSPPPPPPPPPPPTITQKQKKIDR